MKLFDAVKGAGSCALEASVVTLSVVGATTKATIETGMIAAFITWGLDCKDIDMVNDFRAPFIKAGTYHTSFTLASCLAVAIMAPRSQLAGLVICMISMVGVAGVAINAFGEMGVGTCIMDKARSYNS